MRHTKYHVVLLITVAVVVAVSRIQGLLPHSNLVPTQFPVGDLLPASSAAIDPNYVSREDAEDRDPPDEDRYAHLHMPKPAGAIAVLGSARMIVGGQWSAALAFSPDNRWLAAGGEEDVCTLWDVATGDLVRALGGRDSVVGLAFSPDGKTLAVCSQESVRLWNPATGASIGTIAGGAMPQAMTFSHDGTQMAVADYHAVTLWDLATRRLLLRSSGDERPSPMDESDHFESVAVSPDGKWLVAGSSLERLTPDAQKRDLSAGVVSGVDTATSVQFHLWDLNSGKHVRAWETFSPTVLFSVDSQSVIGLTGERDFAAWDVASGSMTRLFTADKAIRSVVMMADGTLSVSDGDTVEFWDWRAGKQLDHTRVRSGNGAIAISADGKLIGSSSSEVLSVTVRATGKPAAELNRHDGGITSVAFAPDGKSVACATDSGFRVWSVDAARPTTQAQSPNSDAAQHWYPHMSYSPDGLCIATTTLIAGEGESSHLAVEMWSTDAQSKWRRTVEGTQLAKPVFLDHGKTLAVAGVNGELHLLDPSDGKTLKDVTPQKDPIVSFVVSPDEKRLASGGKSGAVRIIDSATWTVTRELNAPYPATPQMFSSDGHLLAAVSNDGTAIVWDTDTGTVVRHLSFQPAQHHESGTPVVVFNQADVPFALRTLAADDHSGVEFWNMNSGKKQAYIQGICAGNECDVSRDRRLLGLGSLIDVVIYPMPEASAGEGGVMVPMSEPLPDLDIFAAIRLGRVARVAEFLKKDSTLAEAVDHDGMTALAWAVSSKSKSIVALLLAAGTDVNRNFLQGRTALHCASDAGIARMLLDRGAKVDAGMGPTNMTPLQFVYLNGNIELTRLLLEKGADPNRDMAGMSMLDTAIITKRDDVADLLRKYGAKSSRGQ